MERVFRIINRINSVLFLLLVLAVAALVLYQVSSIWSRHRYGPVAIFATDAGETPREVTLSLRHPTTVAGSETVVISLFGSVPSRGYASKGGDHDLRNFLFVDPDGEARWLLADNRSRIVDHYQVSVTDAVQGPESYDPDRRPTKLFLVVIAALGGDEAEDGRDPKRIALAKPDGSGVVEVLKDVDELLAYWLMPSGTLTLVYQTGGTLHRAQFAGDTLQEISNETIAELPTTL